MNSFILKGDIGYSVSSDKICIQEKGYLVSEGGISKGVFAQIPPEYEQIPLIDYSGKIIVPGLIDLHVHAPQYTFRGLGMDMELLEWLNTYTFPEEGNYEQLEYAKKAYEIFAEDLKKSGTTRVCAFGTIHTKSTLLLMELLEKSGLRGYVGKVSMNRNAPPYLAEEHPVEELEKWLYLAGEQCHHMKPILTPRFIPSCTDELLVAIGQLQERYKLPLQSHLSENKEEVKWVQSLCPEASDYGDAYHRRGTFGNNGKTVMAHCVYSGEAEYMRMKENGVFVAHCPQSNTNLSSGIAPIKKYLQKGLCVGLGTDIAGGHSLSIFRAMADAVQMSKMRWRLIDGAEEPLTFEEAFHMGTKGGGAFFGMVGSFEEGYELDAIVLDDSELHSPKCLNVRERLERLMYVLEDKTVVGKFVCGKQVI